MQNEPEKPRVSLDGTPSVGTTGKTPKSLEQLALGAALCYLAECARTGHFDEQPSWRRSAWRSSLRRSVPAHLREALLDRALANGRLCDAAQFSLLDVLLCAHVSKLELRYVRTWFQAPLARILLSWRGSGLRSVVLEDVAWLGGECRCRSVYKCESAVWNATSHGESTKREVLVFDTPAVPQCPRLLLPRLLAAMPWLTQAHLKFICDDAALRVLGSFCAHLQLVDCSWSPQVSDRGIAALLLEEPQQLHSIAKHDQTNKQHHNLNNPNEKKKKKRRFFSSFLASATSSSELMTTTLALRFSDIFAPAFALPLRGTTGGGAAAAQRKPSPWEECHFADDSLQKAALLMFGGRVDDKVGRGLNPCCDTLRVLRFGGSAASKASVGLVELLAPKAKAFIN
ncbi:unnamed protein product [Notodromas monacha]|uniref:Uncharacterized protein n=1 Tax=Notodromas monacha TaxID=399045 RepID=A0A7R9BSJ3_9CRUS|nr:unnamed protein product [Notodromas monacha]CAG0919907.1 unnamed protein product [Notodromas monacha]